MSSSLRVFLLLGLVFSPFAGAMAFLITYDEYSRHQFERRRLVAMSLEAAAVTVVVILALMIVAALLLGSQPPAIS